MPPSKLSLLMVVCNDVTARTLVEFIQGPPSVAIYGRSLSVVKLQLNPGALSFRHLHDIMRALGVTHEERADIYARTRRRLDGRMVAPTLDPPIHLAVRVILAWCACGYTERIDPTWELRKTCKIVRTKVLACENRTRETSARHTRAVARCMAMLVQVNDCFHLAKLGRRPSNANARISRPRPTLVEQVERIFEHESVDLLTVGTKNCETICRAMRLIEDTMLPLPDTTSPAQAKHRAAQTEVRIAQRRRACAQVQFILDPLMVVSRPFGHGDRLSTMVV